MINKYKVLEGQNLYDVTVMLYGSIEGMFDLFVRNPGLSYESDLAGMELLYETDSVIHQSIVDSLLHDQIIPMNGERHVYPKHTDEELVCCIPVSDEEGTSLCLSGNGSIIVDWGDNSPLETIELSPDILSHVHYFDDRGTDERVVRIYGDDFHIKRWDMSTINGAVLPVRPITVDEIVSQKNNLKLEGLFLCNGTYHVALKSMDISSLAPIRDLSLQTLVLTDVDYEDSECLDEYLIYVATHYRQRRNCYVKLDTPPKGDYREPARDDNGNYIITSGMEAVYVITHEPEWNAAGPWIFEINGILYAGNDQESNLIIPIYLY